MSRWEASWSRSWEEAGCECGTEGEVWDGLVVVVALASLAGNLCSGGRAVGGVVVVVVAGSLVELGEGGGTFVIMAFPSLPREVQVVW